MPTKRGNSETIDRVWNQNIKLVSSNSFISSASSSSTSDAFCSMCARPSSNVAQLLNIWEADIGFNQKDPNRSQIVIAPGLRA